MATITTTAALLVALLILPALILLWATESPKQRARRWRRRGDSYRVIGARLGVAPSTAHRWCQV